MKPTFEKTVDILVKAYLNDTLEHGKCAACAVGNLVAHHLGKEPKPYGSGQPGFYSSVFSDRSKVMWDNVFMTGVRGRQYMIMANYHGEAKRQIDATGYSVAELARIEAAFETAPGRPDEDCCDDPGLDDTWMFNGLIAVVDVLADIHGIDLEKKEAAKLLFVKP